MAKMASQAKGGYYPTPTKKIELICNRLQVQPGTVLYLLDSCAGEGKALKIIGDHFTAKTNSQEIIAFGVELEEERVIAAKQLLYKVVGGGYENLRASNGVFSFLWLNPPYDWSRTDERMDTSCLQDIMDPVKYLQTAGLLVAKALLFLSNGMRKGKILATDPISNASDNIDTVLYAGKVSDLAREIR